MVLSGFATGAFDVVYDRANGDVVMNVTQTVTTAVPEPGPAALLAAGLAVLAFMRRRRALPA